LPKDFIANLERIEVARVGQEHVGSAQLASGRFAMIGDGIDLQLVPWQPPREGRA
jgi:hypothetical protein